MSSSDTIISTQQSKYKSKSRAWKYFVVKDSQLKTAKCKFCQKVLSYRTSVTNLIKHLKCRHGNSFRENDDDKSENGDVSKLSLSDNDFDDGNDDDSEEDNADKVLESTETKNEEESVCLLCQETFPEQDSAKMMDHMYKVHNISQIKLVDGNVHFEQEENRPMPKKSYRSSCWEFFSIKDHRKKTALCNLCNVELSYKATVTNLKKHMARTHNIIARRPSDTHIDSPKKQKYKARSSVWTFFKYVNNAKTVCACVHCDEEFIVPRGLRHMKRHLLDRHPEALLHHKASNDPLFITTGNEDEVEGADEDLHEEFLDFEELDDQDKVAQRPSFERRFSYERRSSFERAPSFERGSSIERRPKRPCRSPVRTSKVPTPSRVPDSLEHFSNYTISLLQELPEKVSKKLQMSFIRQIIEAQISCDESENPTEETATKINSTVDATVVNDPTFIVDVEKSVCGDESVTTAPVCSVDSG